MDLWRLRIFCRVVEQRSFSRAAGSIHLSQPTVSSHVKDLETHFSCRLIDRVGRRIVPTRAGEFLYRRSVALLAHYDEVEAEMAGYLGRVAGRLVIGGSTIPAGYMLPALIGDYHRHYPHVTVSLIVGDTGKILAEVLSGGVELAVVGDRTTDKRMIQKPLLTDEMRVVVPASHPWAARKTVTARDLSREPFIIREHGSGTRSALEKSMGELGGNLAGLNIVAELGSTEAVIQGIKNGIGVSVLPFMAIAADVGAGTLKALMVRNVKLVRTFYLTFLKGHSESPAVRKFRDFLEAAFQVK